MVSTFVAQNRTAISRLFWISGSIALLLAEKMFANRLIWNLPPMTGVVLIGIAMVGRLWCSLCIGGLKNNELVPVSSSFGGPPAM